jgi:mannose-1-phosphate guanylyltransferase
MHKYGIIMAGGGGTRFWPLSRQRTPKQLLNLTGKDLMINETIDRVSTILDKKDIFIVTNANQETLMRDKVDPAILPDHILIEPSARNTAACIGYAAFEIIRKYGDGIMCIFPADHYIKNVSTFTDIFNKAIEIANREDCLLTIGIEPTFPSTGYGYIKYDKSSADYAKQVIEFVEKPNYELANSYVNSGNYSWNSGMFIWKASAILENFKRYLPKVYHFLEIIGNSMNTPAERETILDIYPQIPSISIDYGIMERSDNVKVIPGDLGWNDVGSWDNLNSLYSPDQNGNIIKGQQIAIDTNNCILFSKKRLIATIGIENLIVVETDDAVLVCDRNRAQDIKRITDELKNKNLEEYL